MEPIYLVITKWKEDHPEGSAIGPLLAYTEDYLSFFDPDTGRKLNVLGYEILRRYRAGTPLEEAKEMFNLEFGGGGERTV